MMMRVKLVIISTIAGRNDSIVSSSIVCTLSEYVVPPFGPGLVLNAGRPAVLCANAARGSAAITTGNASFTPRAITRLTCIYLLPPANFCRRLLASPARASRNR